MRRMTDSQKKNRAATLNQANAQPRLPWLQTAVTDTTQRAAGRLYMEAAGLREVRQEARRSPTRIHCPRQA